MKFPISTGQSAQLLNTTEPTLAEFVRRGKIEPAPAVFAGRRLWYATHIRQAAQLLGIETPESAVQAEEGAPHGF
jgi:hypothetical protein